MLNKWQSALWLTAKVTLLIWLYYQTHAQEIHIIYQRF